MTRQISRSGTAEKPQAGGRIDHADRATCNRGEDHGDDRQSNQPDDHDRLALSQKTGPTQQPARQGGYRHQHDRQCDQDAERDRGPIALHAAPLTLLLAPRALSKNPTTLLTYSLRATL